jgi:hypothetical protein
MDSMGKKKDGNLTSFGWKKKWGILVRSDRQPNMLQKR